MTPAIIVIVGLSLFVLVVLSIALKGRATREKEDEAALEAALISWLEKSSQENREKINKALEKRYG